eukprot:GHVQ01020242.1.p1 GENE.GHVQ01020242.1~~GHVQ01020242.1.p1  ORF type:complete len:271 (+),score=49.45 GHVQ01020242.1:319-1131(+)
MELSSGCASMGSAAVSGGSGGDDRLRSQLCSLGARFVGFDDVVADEARTRRETEELKYQEFQDSLLRIQEAMNSEVTRQAEASKSMRDYLQKTTNDMLASLQKQVLSRIETNTHDLDNLLTRCESLEHTMSELKGEMPSRLQAGVLTLVRDVRALKDMLDTDSQKQMESSEQYIRDADNLEASIDMKLSEETAARTKQLTFLEDELQTMSKAEDSNEQQFRGFVLEEVSGLKNGLALATQAREQSDDEIVQALHQYTSALQKGLRFTNLR